MIEEQIKVFEKNISKVINKYEKLLLNLTKEIDFSKLNFETKHIMLMGSELIELLHKSGYDELIKKTIRDNRGFIIAGKDEMIKRLGLKTLKGIGKDTLDGLLAMDFLELEKIGNRYAIEKIQSVLYESVLTGKNYGDTIEEIKITLENKLKGYTETYIRTSKGRFRQKVEDEIAKANFEPGEITWEYVGPDDGATRDECSTALAKQYFTTEEKEAFEAEYGIRFNCRHRFIIVFRNNLTK